MGFRENMGAWVSSGNTKCHSSQVVSEHLPKGFPVSGSFSPDISSSVSLGECLACLSPSLYSVVCSGQNPLFSSLHHESCSILDSKINSS